MIAAPQHEIARASLRDVMRFAPPFGSGLPFSHPTKQDMPFAPTSIANLVAWYRADIGITLNGSNVSAWADISGVGDPNRNLSQGTAGSQPTFVASSANFGGQPTLLANSNDDFLQTGTWSESISQPYTKAVVAIANNGGNSAVATDGSADGSAYIYESAGANTWTAFAGTALGSGVSSTSKSAFVVIFNGGSSSIYINAQTPTSGAVGATNHGAQLTVMNSAASHTFATGVEIAELTMYSRALSGSEVNELLAYFGTRYGITIGP